MIKTCCLKMLKGNHLNFVFCQSREILFVQSFHYICQIIWEIWKEQGSDAAVQCANFRNDLPKEQYATGKWIFTICEFKMRFARVSYIAIGPSIWKRPFHLGLYSLSGKTSYRQISWSLESARIDVAIIVSLWYLTGISAALLPRWLLNFGAIGKVKTRISSW